MGFLDELFGSSKKWHQDHDWCVQKVGNYLKRTCLKVDSGKQLAPYRTVDVYGYDAKKDVYYVCEIKVSWSDVQKASQQLRDTCSYFQKKNRKSTVTIHAAL